MPGSNQQKMKAMDPGSGSLTERYPGGLPQRLRIGFGYFEHKTYRTLIDKPAIRVSFVAEILTEWNVSSENGPGPRWLPFISL